MESLSKDFYTLYPEFRSMIADKAEASVVTPDSDYKLSFICSAGHMWISAPKYVIRGRSCPACGNKSQARRRFAKMVKAAYAGKIIENSRPIIRSSGTRLQLDFLIPSCGVAFEFQEDDKDSLTSDKEPANGIWSVRGNGFKTTPALREEKRLLALDQLEVTVINVWERELYDREALTLKISKAVSAFAMPDEETVTPINRRLKLSSVEEMFTSGRFQRIAFARAKSKAEADH